MSLLNYLRNSLADSERMNIQPDEKNSYTESFENLRGGSVNPETTKELFEKYGKKIKLDSNYFSKKNQTDEEEIDTFKYLPVFVYPLKFNRIFEHGKVNRYGNSSIYPLCLPALLSKTGKLYGDPNFSPFISRLYLSPQARETPSPEIASINDQDNFFTKNVFTLSSPNSDFSSWDKCWEYMEKLWKAVTNTDTKSLEIPNYEQVQDGALLFCSLPQSPSTHVLKLYDILRQDKPLTPLLTAFLSTKPKEKEKILGHKPLDFAVNEKFIAQMNKNRPLSYSQNRVLDHFLAAEKEDFLTINGPPGTGKTTLIQSLIAHIWVKAALDHKEPPIIIATSTNNNAVTNVLESFKTDTVTENILFNRWLPEIQSFGVFCGSSAKIKKEGEIKEGWLVTTPGEKISSHLNLKNPLNIENIEYVDTARVKFKDNFTAAFSKKIEKLSDIIEFLHEKLDKKVKDLHLGCHYQKLLLVPFDKVEALETLAHLEQEVQCNTEHLKIFQNLKQNLPFYIRWGRTFPFFSKLCQTFEQKYFQDFCLTELKESIFNNFYSITVENFLQEKRQKLQSNLDCIEKSLKNRDQLEKQWLQWSSHHNITCSPEDLSDTLDHHPLRSEIFYITTHYWEARWLQDMENLFKQKDPENPKQQWLRRAKLSPCFVSTLYMLPRFFQEGPSYSYNFIDYLIFDESGQINTYIAAPSLSLAKKAIIIGDTKQLEPISVIPETIDKGNCRSCELIDLDKDYLSFLKTGLAAGKNSLMHRAHYLCTFKQEENMEEPGFFLKEHWRCVPEIASYCNELAYNGCLEPKRHSLKDSPYPALGYAHIPGSPELRGGSRYNKLEAYVIGQWLQKNQERLRYQYNNKPLKEIIAIITPFKAQSYFLRSMLNNLKFDPDIIIGTVHALQGAERPLILFSPTYGASDSLQFIDKSVNFLNVALSRAKDSFLVFGNMSAFKPGSATPSGLLARKLFSKESNEIVDIDISFDQDFQESEVEFIDDLDHHRAVLKQCLETAKKKILIICPYISINAVNDDNLSNLIQTAVSQGIEVRIITDQYFDQYRRTTTLSGRKKLEESGAIIDIHSNIHDKVICVDDHMLAIGSFNWLSASRLNCYAKEERSALFKGGSQVSKQIQKNWQRVKSS